VSLQLIKVGAPIKIIDLNYVGMIAFLPFPQERSPLHTISSAVIPTVVKSNIPNLSAGDLPAWSEFDNLVNTIKQLLP